MQHIFKTLFVIFSFLIYPLYAGSEIEVNIKDASTVFEYHNSLDFEITLSQAPGKEYFGMIMGDRVDVYYSTYDDSAKEGEDYIPLKKQKVTFMGSETSKIIHIDIVNDEIHEEREQMFIQISFEKDEQIDDKKLSNSYTIKSKKAFGIIEDDDQEITELNITISDQTIREENSTVILNFPVVLNRVAPLGGINIDFHSSDGSALKDIDYSEVNSSLFIKEGEREGNISVPILGDTEFEVTKRFYLNLTSSSIGKIIDYQAIGIIEDDDPEHPFADLSIQVTDSSDPVAINENLTYTIKAINNGEEQPSQIEVVMELPKDSIFQSVAGSNWDCQLKGSEVKCTYSQALANNNFPISYPEIKLDITTPPENGDIELLTQITSTTRDPNKDNNHFTEVTKVYSKSTDLKVELTSTPNPASVSSLLTYSIKVENLSDVIANNVQLLDALPENVTFVSIDDGDDGQSWSCSQGATIICDYVGNGGNYPANHTSTITLKVNTPADEGTIDNTVKLETTTKDSDLSNNWMSNNTNIQQNSNIAGITAFQKLLQYNINGDITLIGNANLGSNANVSYNDQANMQLIDNDQDQSTTNSTFSTLSLNNNYDIKWAGLYWEGTITTLAQQATVGNILFLTPESNNYTNITASSLNIISDSGFFKYSAFLDVTSLVQQEGTYGVANMTLSTGMQNNGGHFGGWTILIIYEDPSNSLSYKNISVFNGYDYVNRDNFQFSLDGFVTPLSGPINASIAFFAGDGDPAVGGVAQMRKGKTNNFDYVGGDNSNPKNNLLNGSIAKFGTPLDSSVTQTFGVDADIIDVSSFMVNNQKDTTFRFDVATPSGGVDWYSLSMFTFATSLTVPDISSFKKEAVILDENGKATPVNSSTPVYEGSELLYTLTFKNTGTEIARDIEIFDNFEFNKLVDVFDLDTFDGSKIKLSYKNSNRWNSNATCGYDANKKKVWCTLDEIAINDEYKMQFSVRLQEDLPEYIGKSLKNRAYINYKNASTGNYIIRVKNEDGKFGGESNNLEAGIISQKKILGKFNIQRTNSIYNDLDFNLYTQITGRDFDYDIVFYDKNITKEQTLEGVPLKIELIDQGKNNAILYTGYQYYPYETKDNKKDSRVHVTSKIDLKDINASRDAIFKITYIVDEKDNRNILQHRCRSRQTYQNCYDEHLSLNPKTKSILSKDNFSIRPESYYIRLSDNTELLRDSDRKINYAIPVASGYDYNLSVMARIYDASTPAKGYYSKAIQTLDFNDSIRCIDQSSPKEEIQFVDGLYNDLNFTHNNVGEYVLNNIQDNNWTEVDRVKGDCLSDSSITSFREYEKSGCQIKLPVYAINLKFHPYKFDVNLTINNLPNSNHDEFIYMNEITALNHGMEIQLAGSITAQSKNDTRTTNFTSGCVAENINLWLEANITSDRGLNTPLQTTPNDDNRRGDVFFNRLRSINNSLPFHINRHVNDITAPIGINKVNFLDGNSTRAGKLDLDLRYNIDKNITQPINPVSVNFQAVHIDSKTAHSNAEQKTHYIPTGSKILATLKYFYFARVRPSEYVYPRVVYSGQPVAINTPLSVEIFCNIPNGYCNNMQILNNTDRYASPNRQNGWYISTNHNQNLDGNITRLNSLSNGLNVTPNLNQSFINSKNSTIMSTVINGNNKLNRVDVIVPSQLKYDPDSTRNGNPQYVVPQTNSSPSEWTGIGKVGHIIGTKPNTENSKKSSW